LRLDREEVFLARHGKSSLPNAAMLSFVSTKLQLMKKISPASEKKLLLIALAPETKAFV
jgi:hypothetical protein